jgi:hypothetical protein
MTADKFEPLTFSSNGRSVQSHYLATAVVKLHYFAVVA